MAETFLSPLPLRLLLDAGQFTLKAFCVSCENEALADDPGESPSDIGCLSWICRFLYHAVQIVDSFSH